MYLFLESEILKQLPLKNNDVRQTFCYCKVRLLQVVPQFIMVIEFSFHCPTIFLPDVLICKFV